MPSDGHFRALIQSRPLPVYYRYQVLPPIWASLLDFLSLLFVGIVGYLRIFLQVHYFSDVLAGMVLATLIVSAVRFIIPLLYHGSRGNNIFACNAIISFRKIKLQRSI
jgi:membrane-associated phospholipid phosphatase